MTPLMMMSLEPALRWQNWKGSFDEALVFLRPAFADAVEYVSAELPNELRADVTSVLRQLCEPDPVKRGHPLDTRTGGNTFSLERYVTRFDLLAKKAELALRNAS